MASPETLTVSSKPSPRISQNYSALRESGLALIRTLAGDTWTDHNVHDPGITILEAFSYAMTELGFRTQLDIADLLRSSDGDAAPSLPPAFRVLPSEPVTLDDIRKVLLDHPLVSAAWLKTDSDTEVAFYEDPLATPPLSFVASPARVKLRGLQEIVIAFEERESTSNTYSEQVVVGPDTFTVDIALPHWDEPETTPIRRGAVITSASLIDSGDGSWRPLAEPLSYFAELSLSYLESGAPDSVTLWVVLRITSELSQPAVSSPAILAAAQTSLEDTSASSLLARFATRVRVASESLAQVTRYALSYRNLCEDLVGISSVRVQEIAVRARVEVTGSTNLETLLAKVLFAIDAALSPPTRFRDLAQQQADGLLTEDIFDGPLLRHGFLDERSLVGLADPSGVLFVSDILGLIVGAAATEPAESADRVQQENPSGRDIVAVTDLSLNNFINNRPVTQNARDCLRLVEPERYQPRLSLGKSRITFVRNDVEVPYDYSRVVQLVGELQTAAADQAALREFSPLLAARSAERLPISDYLPFQHELPRSYGLGVAGLPASASAERRAQALQFSAYLLPFEQLLADFAAGLGSINRFLSPDPLETASYFPAALFELAVLGDLLKGFTPGGDWQAFVADPGNSYRALLRDAVETRDRFLDRRNRMLDHLLARQGEEAVAWGQELHRWATRELTADAPPALQLPALLETRRRAVNARLIRAKAALFFDASTLNAARLQAWGSPERERDFVVILPSAGRYGWALRIDGEVSLQSTQLSRTAGAARIAAEEVSMLAAQRDFYAIVAVGPEQRYQLRDGTGASARVFGESASTFASVAEANSAADAAASTFRQLRIGGTSSALERKLRHATGIRGSERRRLIENASDLFEIFDEVDSDGIIEKRWRLWERPLHAGAMLLTSPAAYVAATDPAAIALAEAAIADVQRRGGDEWNYEVTSAGASGATFALLDAARDSLGVPEAALASFDAAERAVLNRADFIYLHFSAEGFHVVEHVLLRPRSDAEPFLSIPGAGSDPYSQRLSFVFPSGYARDYALTALTAPRTPLAPHRFRDPEFRRHAERVVRQVCPAHVFPAIYWLDREAPDTAPSASSFEGFEQRYFAWLDAELIAGMTPAAITARRSALIASLGMIARSNG